MFGNFLVQYLHFIICINVIFLVNIVFGLCFRKIVSENKLSLLEGVSSSINKGHCYRQYCVIKNLMIYLVFYVD